MSKYEQISNWENRPLRKSQIHYALLDSVIVLVLLKKLKEDATSKVKLFSSQKLKEFLRDLNLNNF